MIHNRFQNSGKDRKAVLSVLIFFLIGLVSIPGCISDPQEARSFKTLFDHYKEQENVNAISFPPGLVGIFLNDSDPGQAELKKLMQELSSFRMLSINDTSGGVSGDEGNESGEATAGSGTLDEMKESVMEFTRQNEFQDLFRMQSGEQDIYLQIKEKDGIVSEAILMMDADDSFFIIDLRGKISLELFMALAEGGYLDELASLSNINF
jgi:hypothetical protein